MGTGYQLPYSAFGSPDARATGFGTPQSDTAPQVAHLPPDRVIPIVFLPGIMGSNLVITRAERIARLRRDPAEAKSNIAWRPDSIAQDHPFWATTASAADRQLALDPATTAVDVYNPHSARNDFDGDGRHGNVVLAPDFDTPLLRDDPPGAANRRTAAQKARARGWGEVVFDSYGTLLQRVESRMQCIFSGGRLGPGWLTVIDADPVRWGLDPSTPQEALTEADLRAITKGTYFPAHAVGYNWLVDNRRSARDVAKQIRQIVATYRGEAARKHECPGVIIVTHSMGGLLGRALVHPKMGGLQDLVLGMVHGVQPAAGAAAAYARMHAGVEDPGLLNPHFRDSLAAKVIGNRGDEVTAVMANSVGGLQLLPSKAYGNGWLRVHHKGRDLLQLPSKGDPYEEIYKVRGKWYGLFPNEEWVNPAKLSEGDSAISLGETYKGLDAARDFHDALGDHYHAHTYVHYGSDSQRKAFGNVTWRITPRCDDVAAWSNWPIVKNTKQGTVTLVDAVAEPPKSTDPAWVRLSPPVTATIDPPEEAGDQTVPIRSADHQLRSGQCKAIFRQTGYGHQDSYKDESVLEATLYSILKIAQRVQLP